MEVLLESRSTTPFPESMRWAARLGGVFFIVRGIMIQLVYEAVVGLIILYISSYRKRIYLSTEGVVRETSSWFGPRRTVFPWEQLTHLAFAERRNEMMGYFEGGPTGWKVLFDPSQRERIVEIVRHYRPDVEVTEIPQ
ncbi:MAG: hypothetical protein K9L28_09780 [Synergistales bacterium]|nr:hypothetical protein [Synergistales bacterium]